MTKYNVVAVEESTGKIIGVEQYDATNDAGRGERIQLAASKIAAKLGVQAPGIHPNRGTLVDGIDWGKMIGDIQVGMVETESGKWGF